MHGRHWLWAWGLASAPALTAGLASQSPAAATSSPQLSHYAMRVELAAAELQLRGTQTITWRNPTAAPAAALRFHLYLNAFRDLRSTFMREASARYRAQWRPHELGSIEVLRLEVEDRGQAADLTAALHFVQPDDGNADDATVLEVPLPRPVPPGGSLAIRTAFRAALPKAYSRTGYMPGAGFFLMHWFPKLGVLEERDGVAVWNCHQFHANSEFFASFSDYEVEIVTPAGFEVAATGALVRGPTAAEGGQARVFRAERVHDFAWVADPDFVRHVDSFGPVRAAEDPMAVAVADKLGVDVSTFDLPATEIALLLRPEHDTAEQVARHFAAARCALEFYGLRFGPFPYRSLAVIDPGADVLGRQLGGGMEYPLLITGGTSLFPHPRKLSPEGVVVHEVGHQYWYGLSANNEFEAAWLDEGINTYSEGRAQWLRYDSTTRPVQTAQFGPLTLAGEGGRFAPLPTAEWVGAVARDVLPAAWWSKLEDLELRGAVAPASPLLALMALQPMASYAREVWTAALWSDRHGMLAADNPDPMVLPGWQYRSRESYVANSYYRPATLLRTLERMVGRDAWWAFLRRFHMQARFGHPTTADFATLLAECCGREAAEFFARATAANAVLDYGVDAVEPADGGGPRRKVVIRRFGPLAAEVQVRLRFAGRPDPVYRTVAADAAQPITELRFDDLPGEPPWGRLLEVWVDPPESRSRSGEPFEHPAWPAGVYILDENLLNNAWRAEIDHRPALYRGIRLLLQAQSRLSFAALIG